jgi:hypothetical protein
MPLINDIVTRFFINGDWRDVSTDVRAANGISYTRGRKAEDNATPPQRCSFDLDNRNGTWSDRNPLGAYYGHLRRNTPMETSVRVVKDTATTTASNGWGSTDTATGDAAGSWQVEPWTVTGTASDYAKAGGKATHAMSNAGSVRISYLSAFRGRDVDVSFTVQLNVTNVTGSSLTQGIAIGNVMLRGQGAASTYYLLRLVVQTDETLTVDWFTHTLVSLTNDPLVVPGITHVNTNVYRVRAQAEGRTLRAKVWLDGTSEPYEWLQYHNDEMELSSTDTMRDAQGWVGIRSSQTAGNTNTNIVVSYDDFEVRVPIFAGEISEWPQERDVTGEERLVNIVAQGPKRRIAQGNSLAKSAIYNFTLAAGYLNVQKLPYVYWPLEGGEQTGSDTRDIMGTTSRLTFNRPNGTTTVGRIKWGGDTTRPGSLQSPTITGGGALNGILEPPTDNTAWAVQWQWKLNFREGTTATFQTVALPGGGQITVVPNHLAGSNSVTVGLTAPGVSNNNILSYTFDTDAEVEDWHTFAVSAEQLGSDTVFFLYVDGTTDVGHTQTGMTLASLNYVAFASLPDTTSDFAIGHITVYSGDLGAWSFGTIDDAAAGWVGESGANRSDRLADEYNFEFDWIANGGNIFLNDDGKTMGPQRVAALTSLLDDCERIDGGLLYEQRSIVGLQFRTLQSMLSRSPWATLDMGTSKHLSPPLQATADDRGIVNAATAQRVEGGEFTVTKLDGPMAAVPAYEGGIGEYPKSITFNAELEADLPDLASWTVANGTIDQERYPGVKVELHRSAVLDTSGLLSKLRELDVGDLIRLDGLESNYVYDDPDVVVLGIAGHLDKKRHTLTLNTVPGEVYRTLVIGSTAGASTEFSRLDSDTTVIDEDLDTTETGVTIEVEADSAFWVNSTDHAAHFPFNVIVGGELMTVTACTAPSGQNQTMTVTRSVNGVVKTHTAGAKLSLAKPNYYGL